MKRILLFLFVVFSLSTVAKQKIKNPEVEYTPAWIEIQTIEQTTNATILHCTLHNLPNNWVRINDKIVLQDAQSNKSFKLLRTDSVKTNEQIWMPQSGSKSCVLYFEPLDKTIKLFNMIEPGSPANQQTYGIQLKSTNNKQTKTTLIGNRAKTADEYLKLPSKNSDWTFDPSRYKDLDFCKSQSATLRIHIAHLPNELRKDFGVMSAKFENQFNRKENIIPGELNKDNCVEFQIPLNAPQFVSIMPIMENVYVQGGDTLDLYTTAECNSYRRVRYKSFCGNSESAMINTLIPVLMKKLINKEYDYHFIEGALKQGNEGVKKALKELSDKTIELIESDKMHQIIRDTPLSIYGKDLLMTCTLCQYLTTMEDMMRCYDGNRYIVKTKADGSMEGKQDSTFIPLDYESIYRPLLKYKSLIYDNPLVISESQQWIFLNKTLYGPLFINIGMRFHPEQYGLSKEIKKPSEEFNMEGTFMNDLFISQLAASRYNDLINNYQLEKCDTTRLLAEEMNSVRLSTEEMNTTNGLMEMHYPKVAYSVMDGYRNMLKTTEGNNTKDITETWTPAQKALWDKLTSQYHGNLMLIDFWALYCGQCRLGMLNMRKNVEELKNEKFKFLYICNEGDTPRDKGEKWMSESKINGEHIYVTPSEWELLRAMFNFTGIPRAAIIGRDGKIIQYTFDAYFNADKLKNLLNKF
ncbi:TlpA family protein disulfide reductase [Prevotella sp.]|uniref:TlpA family protein disulfide reductase n=1 Tax=Prevotella sp. TaxID=59823 RepID=UPI002648F24A|nr:TlpA family protein disulfide reductase [Prevotella sp.]MDN5553970.1 TlpA family protein disulfide reductase [Prevotella sp.]